MPVDLIELVSFAKDNSFKDAYFPCIKIDHTSNLQHHLFCHFFHFLEEMGEIYQWE